MLSEIDPAKLQKFIRLAHENVLSHKAEFKTSAHHLRLVVSLVKVHKEQPDSTNLRDQLSAMVQGRVPANPKAG
jgi:hypothetical protein